MLAAALGAPSAVRAVAGANALNRCAVVTPCHRVIGTDGRLTGYAGGLPRKQWLIEHEARHAGQASVSQRSEA
jgi:AraC family transcriptional regulator of adaptative response/methylated-DNA-[protein]-cysteine methyltransferase